ncbi:MAG TPA: adenosylcobinamide-GDP ribazoletransferase [Candidatus Melainabacteria bacterium]|nr:adenosylcobinamide-GDP ribazoletransferase [Candidatus Melainabacteria bacterium]
MHKQLRRLLVTASYVTCLPLARIDFNEPELLHGLSKYLPSAGLIIGTLLFALNSVLCVSRAEPMVVAFLITAAWLILTNGLHFDGLMDAADGIFSHQSKERMLEIMSDSRVGNFGAVTGFIVLLGKFVAINALTGASLGACLIVIPAWSRWCELYAIGKFTYAKEHGKGKIWHDTTVYPVDLLKGALPPLAVTFMFGIAGFPIVWTAMFFSMAAGIIFSHLINKKIGGQTGDTYGATVEISELICLLALSIFT